MARARSLAAIDNGSRRRTSNACDRCRRHKIKCSGQQPCGTCNRRQQNCVFSDKRRFSQQYVRDLQRRVAAAEQRAFGVDAAQDVAEEPLLPSPESYSNSSDPRTRRMSSESITASEVLPSHTHRPSTIDRHATADPPTLINHLAMGRSFYVPDNKGKATYLGTSSTWSFGRRVLLLAQERVIQEPLPANELLWEGRAYDLGWHGERSAECLPRIDGAVLPQADFGMYLVNTVKFYIGQLFHLFDEVDFMDKFSKFYDRSSGDVVATSLWYNHYLLILAFGKAFTAREKRDSQKPPGCAFFLQAISTLPDLAFADADPLEAIEVLCCAALYLHSIDFRGAAFRMIGQALRFCHENGFHTEMNNYCLPEQRLERARECWWTVLLLDRQMSSLMGVPVSTRDDDITAKHPSFRGCSSKATALDINVKLSSIVASTVTNVYGKEGRLSTKFLIHTKAALKSIAQVTNELNESFPLPVDVTGGGISRVAAYLHLLHHQCIVLATRPVLFNYFEANLPHGHRRTAVVRASDSIVALLQMCKESSLQMLRILLLLQSQGLLESFLPFDLDATYSSATILQMAAHVDSSLMEDERPWLQAAYGLLEEMSIRGNHIAAISKADLLRLQSILTLLPQRSHPTAHESETAQSRDILDRAENHSIPTTLVEEDVLTAAEGHINPVSWLTDELVWQDGLDADHVTSVADAIDLDGMSWWFEQDSMVTT